MSALVHILFVLSIELYYSHIVHDFVLIVSTYGGLQTVRVLRHQWAYSCDKAKRELGYNPRNLTEGLAEMLLWLKNDKLIKF